MRRLKGQIGGESRKMALPIMRCRSWRRGKQKSMAPSVVSIQYFVTIGHPEYFKPKCDQIISEIVALECIAQVFSCTLFPGSLVKKTHDLSKPKNECDLVPLLPTETTPIV